MINAFNTCRQHNVIPGENLLIDECMSKWKGMEAYECHTAIPFVSKIARKPQGVGCEMKSLLDTESNIMLYLEVMKGKDVMKYARYVHRRPEDAVEGKPNYQQYATDLQQHKVFKPVIAQILRLTYNYHGSGRTVHGDGYFGSVGSTCALLNVGLFARFILKTGSTKYPKHFLSNWCQTSTNNGGMRGAHKVLKTSVNINNEHHNIMALAWNDRKPKFIIASKGNTLAADPSYRVRHRIVQDEHGQMFTERYRIAIPRPNIVQQLYENFAGIDVHDHMRQGVLGMEDNITRSWAKRIYFTIFGMVVVDCYYAYKLDYRNNHHGSDQGILEPLQFYNELFMALIFNNLMVNSNSHHHPTNDEQTIQVYQKVFCFTVHRNVTFFPFYVETSNRTTPTGKYSRDFRIYTI
jgi:hypothetical protein